MRQNAVSSAPQNEDANQSAATSATMPTVVEVSCSRRIAVAQRALGRAWGRALRGRAAPSAASSGERRTRPATNSATARAGRSTAAGCRRPSTRGLSDCPRRPCARSGHRGAGTAHAGRIIRAARALRLVGTAGATRQLGAASAGVGAAASAPAPCRRRRTSVTRRPNSSSITTTSPRAIGLPLTSRSTGSPASRLSVTIEPGPSASVSRIVMCVRPISTASSTGTS